MSLSQTLATLRKKVNAAGQRASANLEADMAIKQRALAALEIKARAEAAKAADLRTQSSVLKNQIRDLQEQQASDASQRCLNK